MNYVRRYHHLFLEWFDSHDDHHHPDFRLSLAFYVLINIKLDIVY